MLVPVIRYNIISGLSLSAFYLCQSKPLDKQVADEEDCQCEEDQVPHEFVMSSFGNVGQPGHGGLQESSRGVKLVVHVAEKSILRPNFVADVDGKRF